MCYHMTLGISRSSYFLLLKTSSIKDAIMKEDMVVDYNKTSSKNGKWVSIIDISILIP